MPTPGSALIPVAGDMNINPGLWVKHILANPQKSLGKYAHVYTEVISFEDILKVWSEVTGKQVVYVECSEKDYVKIWGVLGEELVAQLKFGETVKDWNTGAKTGFVTAEELGIKDAIGLKAAFENLRPLL